MKGHKFKVGRIYYGWYYEVEPLTGRTKQVKKSTGCTDAAAADKVIAGWERRAADPHGTKKAEAKLQDAFDLLFRATEARAKAKKPTRSEDTVGFQRKQSKSWLLFAGLRMTKNKTKPDDLEPKRKDELRSLGESFPLAEVDGGFVDDFLAWRRFNGVGEGTIGKDLSVLRPACRFALRAKLWGGSLEEVFPKHEIHYEPGTRWAERAEIDAVVAKMEPGRAAVVAFVVATGAEPRAVERALRADLGDDRTTLLHIRGTKRKARDRYVPILFDWQQELLAFTRKHADGREKMFSRWSNQRRVLGEACDRADVEHLSLTDLRRSHAHWMKNEGVRQEDLMVSMGHSSRKMLDQVYGKATTGAELHKRMAEAAAERRAALVVIDGGLAKKSA